MNYISYVIENWQIISVAAIVAMTGITGEIHGRGVIKERWAIENAKAQTVVLEKERANSKLTQEKEDALQKLNAAADNEFNGFINGLLITASSGLPSNTKSTSGCNAKAINDKLLKSVRADIEEQKSIATLMHQADIQTNQLVVFQNWYIGIK